MGEDEQLIAEVLDAAANALHSLADKLRLEPNGALAKAIRSSKTEMGAGLNAEFKIGYEKNEVEWVAITGSTCVPHAELSFRTVWRNGVVSLVPDKSASE